MSIATNAIKATAKYTLKNNWIKSIVVTIICMLTMDICYNCTALLTVLSDDVYFTNIAVQAFFVLMIVFLISPIIMGYIRFVWRSLFSVYDEPVGVFYWFSSVGLYAKVLKFIISIIFRAIMWFVIFSIPTLFLKLLSTSYIFELFDISTPLWTANLSLFITFTETIAIVATMFMLLKYYMAPVLFVADEDMDGEEALLMSKIISRKTSVDFIYLCFSFTHWIFLSFLGMPLIFTLPYMITAYAVHVRFSVTEYNIHMNKITEEDFYNPPFGV